MTDKDKDKNKKKKKSDDELKIHLDPMEWGETKKKESDESK